MRSLHCCSDLVHPHPTHPGPVCPPSPHPAQEVDAAHAYDRALVRLRGRNAATNFALSDYRGEMADFHQMQNKMLKGDAR